MTAPHPVITHDRDLILSDAGEVEQDYNFLDYDFAAMGLEAWGRTYLDEATRFSFRTTVTWAELPEPVRAYLTHRFDTVLSLNRDGYRTIWHAPDQIPPA